MVVRQQEEDVLSDAERAAEGKDLLTDSSTWENKLW